MNTDLSGGNRSDTTQAHTPTPSRSMFFLMEGHDTGALWVPEGFGIGDDTEDDAVFQFHAKGVIEYALFYNYDERIGESRILLYCFPAVMQEIFLQ